MISYSYVVWRSHTLFGKRGEEGVLRQIIIAMHGCLVNNFFGKIAKSRA